MEDRARNLFWPLGNLFEAEFEQFLAGEMLGSLPG